MLLPYSRNLTGSSNCYASLLHAVGTKLCQGRFILLFVLIVICIIVYHLFTILGNHGYYAAYDRKGSIVYLKDKILNGLGVSYQDSFRWDGKVGDKVIVMAHTMKEDVSWVEEHLPE